MGQWWPAAGSGSLSVAVCTGPFEGGRHYLHYLHQSGLRANNREAMQPLPSTENWILKID